MTSQHARTRISTAPDGTVFRDLNRNGVMDPYEDPRLSPDERAADLLARLSLPEKVGLLFHTVIESGPGGTLVEGAGAISKSPTSEVVLRKHLTHFNVHQLGTPREAARWANALQALAETTPHGIPVTISTDPRHAFVENAGVAFAAGSFSQWPEPLGLAALEDETIRHFARVVNQEYRAVGIRAALHPQVDLATEPRWGRQAQTFGSDVDRTCRALEAYLDGMQGEELGPESVACVTKHFPGGGPQLDGEDAHFPYGREQVYPGGRFEEHLAPFRVAIARGTAGMMPYYGMPVGLVRGGEAIAEVGFGYNRQIVTDLLRTELGYDGVVVTDWELVNDNHVGGQVLPARAWGVEHLTPAERMVMLLDAGTDQFGGEECTDLLLELVAEGRVTEQRIDASALRLLRQKFQLGLFDDPYVDEDEAERIVGRADFVEAGLDAQAASVTVLENDDDAEGRPLLPLTTADAARRRVYVEGIPPEVAATLGTVVADPADADLALIRLEAPYDPRNDLFLEAWFHQGSLDFRPGLVARLARIAAQVPVVVDVVMDRPAILTPLVPLAAALTASFGTSPQAYLAAITGERPPRGRLPFDIPRSMDAVRASLTDVANDTPDALYRAGDGLTLERTDEP